MFPPPRHFSWSDSESGGTYVARLFRDQRKIFEARRKKPNVTIPIGVRLTSGLYEWQVATRRRAGGRAQLLVEWTFVCNLVSRGTACTLAVCRSAATEDLVLCRQV